MGIATGLNCGAGGRAYGAGCVTIGELNSFLSEPIDVWGPVKVGTLTTQIHPAHVIDKNQNNVGSFGLLLGEGMGSG